MKMETTKVINQSSMEVNKNSRGFTWSVKAYGDTPDETQQKLNELINNATGIVAKLEVQEAAK